MTTSSQILVDPDALLDARRELLRGELDLLGMVLRPPAPGPISDLMARVFRSVGSSLATVGDDLHRLADALDRFVDDLVAQDGQVSLMFDLLRMRGLS